jgi:glutathione S-transferase
MADYRLFGAETSPYSLKVRSALRYKGVAFDWVSRSISNEAAFRASAPTPTVPLLLSPNHPPAQDSTAILAALEASYPEPAAQPEEPVAQALALILEDYGDEWLNKCMFQKRWGQQPDRDAAALRVLVQLNDGKRPRAFKAPARQIASRMLARLPLVGAEPDNAPMLESSYRRFALQLNAHLQDHLFIFGGRPSAADFAIAAQFQQMLTDPTPGTWLRERAPFMVAWCTLMDDPKASGPHAPLSTLEKTLLPIFSAEVSRTYLPWAAANAASASRQGTRFSVSFDDGLFEQTTQSYAARAFGALRRDVAARMSDPALVAFLEAAGARAFFA